MDAAIALRGVQTALLALAFGMGALLRHANHTPASLKTAALLGLQRCTAALVLLQVARLSALAWSLQDLLAPDASPLSVFQTHGGQVLLGQGVVLLLALAAAWRRPSHGQLGVLLFMLLLAMCAMGWSGHAVAAAEDRRLSFMALLHVLLAQCWLAGVLGLLYWARHAGVSWVRCLAVFSKWALPGMALLLASGVFISLWSVGSWPALLATAYGWMLLIKLGLVAGALCCAYQLRRWLPSHETQPRLGPAWLNSEVGLALAVLLAASVLAGTVPGAHDTVVWPLGFRWAPLLAWRQDPTSTTQMLGLSVALWLLAGLGWAWWRRSHARRALAVLAAGVFSGLLLALPAISITAYPSTYMHSPVRLDSASVMAGQALYGQHCMDCHGVHGQGDGPLAVLGGFKPANLTEPHVSWHTHGDMFWWLSHGKGAMPGFADVLSVQERWHLINWLIALSLGHEARTLTSTPAPFNPWLPSIDFRFQMDNNNFMSLSEWRGLHAVHLVVVNQASEMQRVRALLQDMKGFPAQLVIVSRPEWLKDLVKGPCEAVLVPDPEGEIGQAWAHYRRSFANPDLRNEELLVPRMEFLIDRYGFVRARWRSDEWPNALSLPELKAVYDSLSAEGEIKSAAIHQHD